ncbi:MAG: hypothetical protein H7836_08090 [Magnetococcus sp. YQC-3]
MDDYSKLRDLLVTFSRLDGFNIIPFAEYKLRTYKNITTIIHPNGMEELYWNAKPLIQFVEKENLIDELIIRLEEYLIGLL